VTVLQLIERATSGWGLNLHYFRVPYLLAGPWYLSWLTSFAGLTLMLAWGMWLGTIYRRWNLPGLLAFIAAQALALLAVAAIIGWAHGVITRVTTFRPVGRSAPARLTLRQPPGPH
jgi:hypothetical protein